MLQLRTPRAADESSGLKVEVGKLLDAIRAAVASGAFARVFQAERFGLLVIGEQLGVASP